MMSFLSKCFFVVTTTMGVPSVMGFITPKMQQQQRQLQRHEVVLEATTSSRRSFVESSTAAAFLAGLATATTTTIPVPPAYASGGATAGGAYLLSAKQRYNERVKKGATGFLNIRQSLESGNIDGVRKFFADEDEGSWKDLTAAGYLLANAFRTNSSAAPDSLPSVKKWKAFTGQVEGMTKALKKKDTDGALKAYDDAVAALDEYLAKVELPTSKELK